MSDHRLSRRYHPDGSPLYDVLRGNLECIGLVRQHPGERGWFAYGPRSGEPFAANLPTRREAVTAVLQHAAPPAPEDGEA